MREGYDVAQICNNGHVANSSTQNMPEFNQQFCETCGAATIVNCPDCTAPIRGSYWGGGIGVTYKAPRFCISCGKPFPWTKSKIEAAGALAKELGSINEEDREILEKSIDELVKDSPSTQVAAIKFKKVMTKAGSGAASIFRDLLTDVLSETAKKILWP